MPALLYISSCQEDREFRLRLEQHLAPLIRRGHLKLFDERILPDQDLGQACAQAWVQADVVLALISPAYLWEPRCQVEMREVLARRDQGVVRLIPVLIKPVAWETSELAGLATLPRSGLAISRWPDPDEALTEVTREIASTVRTDGEKGAASAPLVVILHAPEDQRELRRFESHLGLAVAQGDLRYWHIGHVPPGDSVLGSFSQALERAALIVVLLSPALVGSDQGLEFLHRAVRREQEGWARLIPVLLSAVEVPRLIAHYRAMPMDDRPIVGRGDSNQAWLEIIRSIRLTLESPRGFPDDPAQLLRWAKTARLADLREALSEPPLAGDASIVDQMARRLTEASPGERRTLVRACEVPGRLAVLSVRFSGSPPANHAPVAAALLRLREPETQPAGGLVCDILWLRHLAEENPLVPLPAEGPGSVDLREILPDLLQRCLRSAMLTPEVGSFAAAEARMLLLCVAITESLGAAEGTSGPESLWLGYRLCQWLHARLESLTPERRHLALSRLEQDGQSVSLPRQDGDLLHPSQFTRDGSFYRQMALLFAIGPGASVATALRPVSSGALRDSLLVLCGQELRRSERALMQRRSGSCLGWDPEWPASRPEAALQVLLYLDPSWFLALPSPLRLTWLRRIPPGEEGIVIAPLLLVPLLDAAAGLASALEPAERRTLKERALDLQGRPAPEAHEMDLLRASWFALIQLYGAGEHDLLDTLQDLFAKRLTEPAASELFGHYLLALASADPLDLACRIMVSEYEGILALVRRAGLPAADFVIQLARVINTGRGAAPHKAMELLREAAMLPDLAHAESLQRLARRLETKG